MPIFIYTGQNSQTGKKVKGQVESDSAKSAKLKLRKQNVYVVEIKEETTSQGGAGGTSFWQSLNRKPPTPEDIAVATKQLSILVKAAVDISEALKAVSEQLENAELRSIYSRIREKVSEGKSLSEAHGEFPKVFSLIYVNMIAASEKAGALGLVLSRLSEFVSYQIAIRRKVIGALTYPIFMLIAAFAIMIFMFVSILPKITKAFSTLKVTLPWYTVALNGVSAFMQDYWIVMIVAFVGGGIFFSYWSQTPKGKRNLDYFLYNAPIAGPLMQKVSVSRFSKTLATVLSSGVRIMEGLQLTRNVVGNAVLEDSLDEVMKRVQDGEKLASALEKTNRFPGMVIHMLKTGEKTGKMEEMLTNIAEVYDEEVDQQISMTTKLIEPAMMIFMAGFVLIIVMAILMPMMQAMNSLK